jgi:hypothetical protein
MIEGLVRNRDRVMEATGESNASKAQTLKKDCVQLILVGTLALLLRLLRSKDVSLEAQIGNLFIRII